MTTLHRATRISSGSEMTLSPRAIAELAQSLGEVDMASMPHVPADAPCRRPGVNADLWFDPMLGSPVSTQNVRLTNDAAKRLCAGCPVIGECLKWALNNPRQGGVMGGMTARARRALYHSRSRNARGNGVIRPLR